jgi:NAD(P)-dependent dehydrogenase (short-subunit alcohol dehydrogenase family)
MYEACPNAEINQCWAKLGSFLGGYSQFLCGYSQRRADVAKNHRTPAADSGGRPAIVAGDLGAKGGPAEIAAEALAALGGRVDILVNNAGAARPITGEADDAFWDEALTSISSRHGD